MSKYIVSTFYKFVSLPNYIELKELLLTQANKNKIKGTILLAEEGINATLSGKESDILNFESFLNTIVEFSDIRFKNTLSDFIPFQKMKVRLKKEIVKIMVENLNAKKDAGERLTSDEWDALLTNDKEKVLLIDTRNYYEITFGTFKNAINPETNSFSELTEWLQNYLQNVKKETKIAMFCTGGVRCEKSTAYVKNLGFKNVYHLKDGILKYMEERKNSPESLWEGNLFIFDDRIALDKNLKPIHNANYTEEK